MSALKVLALVPAWLLLTAFSQEASPSPTASPAPTPSVVPTPTAAYINLDLVSGDANSTITVSGGSFNPGENLSIIWDTTNKVIGSTTADANGNFANVKVKPFAGEQPGLHHICASVNPYPCAQFVLQGPPSPTPSPTTQASPSASASPAASETPTSTPLLIPPSNNGSTNGLDVLLHPPFIFIPFLAALALLAAIVYWYVGTRRAGARAIIDSGSIVHRITRPGYGLSDLDIRPAPLGPTPEAPSQPAPPDNPDETPPITES